MITIQNHRAHLHGAPVAWRPSPNISGRMEPQLVVVHETAGRLDPGSAVSWLCTPRSKVSAHFVIERDGTIVQLVDCDRVAWHAGVSTWQGRANCNAFSIGIELVGPGKLTRRGTTAVAWFGQAWPVAECDDRTPATHGGAGLWLPFTAAQQAACEGLIAALLAAYPRIEDVVGHYEISPGRKVDPAPTFDLRGCKVLCTGRPVSYAKDIRHAQNRLLALGYDPGDADGLMGPKTRGALWIFQGQNELAQTGELDARTLARLGAADAVPMTTGLRTETTKADVQTRETKLFKRGVEAYGVVEVASALDGAQATVSRVKTARSLSEQAGAILEWATTGAGMKTVGTLAALGLIWWGANRVDWQHVRARVKGRLSAGRARA